MLKTTKIVDLVFLIWVSLGFNENSDFLKQTTTFGAGLTCDLVLKAQGWECEDCKYG